MLSEELLEPKQDAAIARLFAFDETILIAPTGAGKTIICLSAVKELIEAKVVKKVIVSCPAKVVPVWKKEAAKWEHTQGLRVTTLAGPPDKRSEALLKEADILVISLNSLDWLLRQKHGADGVIIDELSKASGKQAKGLKSKKLAGVFKWRVGMTATPVSQDFEKLYGMLRIIDKGAALGTNKSKYLSNYFYSDYMGYNWTLRDGGAEMIMNKICHLVHTVEDTKAVDLPACHYHEIRFEMPEKTRAVYNEMKKDMVAGDVEAVNEAVKSGKLRQIASGFLYRDGATTLHHDLARFNAMKDWVAALNGKPGLVFYEFIDQEDWVQDTPGSIRFAQINSMSHGVDGLQDTYADVLFLQPMWSRDATEQAIGRVWRTGQKKEVNVTTLVCDDTLDDLVMSRVSDRAEFMKLFLLHLKN
ncbi:SNF2-related protein [bacterium]|nr:SNF2-related protein [bacterium]